MGKNGGFSWRLLLYATLVTIVICLVDALLESDALLYFFLVIPIVSLSLLSWLLAAAIAREPRSCITIVAILTIYWALSFGFRQELLHDPKCGKVVCVVTSLQGRRSNAG
jgi:hypothetical protein